jgi:ribosomal protein S12 methylthiotransferase accessory factor
MIKTLTLDIALPAGFPEKYREAVIRAADQCAVKKHLLDPPTIRIETHYS